MTTTTLSSKYQKFFDLYKSIFRRNIGYFTLLSALLAVFYPLQYILEITKSIPTDRIQAFARAQAAGYSNPFSLYRLFGGGYNFTGVSAFFFALIVLLAPIVLALLLNSYMHSKKAVDVYHALPLRRGTLLGVNMAVAMSYIAIPVVVYSLLIMVIQIVKFGFVPAAVGWILLDTLCWLVAAFCLYAVTTFVSVLAGTVFDTFVFTGALLLAPPAFFLLGMMLASMFLFGFTTDTYALLTAANLSPATVAMQRFAFMPVRANPNTEMLSAILQNNIAMLVWLVLGILIFCVAVRLYRTRHSERAETTTSKGLLPTAVKLIGTVAVSVFAGMIFQTINSDGGKAVCLLWTAITGILTYSILEVILNRGFKTIIRSLPLGAAMVAATVGLCAVPMTGAFGYENRIPAAEEIATVEIDQMGRYSDGITIRRVLDAPNMYDPGELSTEYLGTVTLSDPAALAAVLDFHQDVVGRRLVPQEGFTLEPGESFAYSNTNITYTLKNGKTIRRRYSGASQKTIAKLAPLEVNPEFLRKTNGAFFTVPKDITEWTVSDIYGSNRVSPNLSLEDTTQLLQAMQNDLLALTLEELKHPTQKPEAILSYFAKQPNEVRDRFVSEQHFVVSAATKETYKFLNDRSLLQAVAPDLSECYAVSVVTMGDGRSGRNAERPILELSPSYSEFSTSELENIREELEYYKENKEEAPSPDMYIKEDYQMSFYGSSSASRLSTAELYETPEEIALFAENVVGSFTVDEPLLYANFYFKNRASGTSVLIPRW